MVEEKAALDTHVDKLFVIIGLFSLFAARPLGAAAFRLSFRRLFFLTAVFFGQICSPTSS